jgi:hypothetical protein
MSSSSNIDKSSNIVQYRYLGNTDSDRFSNINILWDKTTIRQWTKYFIRLPTHHNNYQWFSIIVQIRWNERMNDIRWIHCYKNVLYYLKINLFCVSITASVFCHLFHDANTLFKAISGENSCWCFLAYITMRCLLLIDLSSVWCHPYKRDVC